MAYKFYIGDKILLPVTPEKLTMNINNANKTITMIDGAEINLLKAAGLTTISFDAELPNRYYPYCNYSERKFKKAEYFLDILENLKINKTTFQFIVIRQLYKGKLYDTNITVALEDYKIIEDAKNGIDVTVSITLKQYKERKVKILTIPEQTLSASATTTVQVQQTPQRQESSNAPTNNLPSPYVVVSGDCLWNICKKYLGDGSRCYEIATYNNISNPNLIYPGDYIYFPQ